MELVILGIALCLIVLAFIKYTGLQSLLRRTRQEILAGLYEMLLYRRRPAYALAAQCKTIWASLKHLFFVLPVLALGVLVFLCLRDGLSNRYGYAPTRVGQDVVIRCRLKPSLKKQMERYDLVCNSHDLITTSVVRVASVRTVWTRLKATKPGLFRLTLGIDSPYQVFLNVARPDLPAIPRQHACGLEAQISYEPRQPWAVSGGYMLQLLLTCMVASVPLRRLLKVSL